MQDRVNADGLGAEDEAADGQAEVATAVVGRVNARRIAAEVIRIVTVVGCTRPIPPVGSVKVTGIDVPARHKIIRRCAYSIPS